MDDVRTPQAHHFVLPLMAGALFGVWAYTRPPSDFSVVLFVIAGVFGVWTLANAVHFLVSVLGYESRQRREIEFRFSPNYRLEVVSRMNSEQIKAVRAGTQIVEILPGESGPVEKLAGENCYLYTAWWILVNSTEAHVYPINRFQTGTFHFDVLGDAAIDDQHQAKNFHHWLYVNGYATWGRGNTSMSWNEGWNKERVMKLLGLEEDTYAD